MRFAWLTTVLLACGDDGSSKPNTDAAVDAPVDSTGTACTGAIYDPCSPASTTSSQCTSMNCHLFMGDQLTVCTQTCTPGTACPMAGSTPVTCNMNGLCKPPTANNCTR